MQEQERILRKYLSSERDEEPKALKYIKKLQKIISSDNDYFATISQKIINIKNNTKDQFIILLCNSILKGILDKATDTIRDLHL